MSIIEKAAGKLDQIEKRGGIPPCEETAKPLSGGGVSIIEKAAGKLDQIEKMGAPSSVKMTPEMPEHPDPKAISGNPESRAGIYPTLSPEDPVSKQGMINLAKLRQLGMIIPDGERSQIAEEFRLIKRPLLKNAFTKGAEPVNSGNLIMVTSALAGEGKTFCAANLAMSIAMELDHTVLLVDADVARPSLPKYLGLEPGRGLLDVLLDDKLDLSDVLIRTNVEKLSILQAGSRHKRATELLASQAMSDLLKEIARRYPDRIVIFDSPPLLLTSEAHVLASQMGQIVLVVAAESTTQQSIKEALRQIEACDIVNLIYNKARAFAGGEYYGYYG
ncbi:MAG: XrtA-associated tyrosine autokinase [Gammaproteobacteria bacterium]|nr:XrtA-associated tyrosine autokinase [Gammaproteobacteria bacterium]MBU1977829.1 XrtA-associated tyrosine autokinase [Gammaproteobacteria bacterium]